jgi:hypothetical protein
MQLHYLPYHFDVGVGRNRVGGLKRRDWGGADYTTRVFDQIVKEVGDWAMR